MLSKKTYDLLSSIHCFISAYQDKEIPKVHIFSFSNNHIVLRQWNIFLNMSDYITNRSVWLFGN